LLGVRAQQIASGAPILVELTPDLNGDPLLIAEKELREKKIDMIIRRKLPNGRHEDWNVTELILEDEF
jgi:DNA-directed RNA polymerase subunit K/omega